MSENQPIALVVDDDADLLASLAGALEALGWATWRERTADAALRRLEREARGPDVVLIDLVLPGMSAPALLAQLRGRAPWWSARLVLMTGASVKEIPRGLSYDAVLLKPFTLERLREVVAPGQPPPAP
jgi:CheY-like chemotaxis protein